MSETHIEFTDTQATAPQSPTPGQQYNWNKFYGVPAQTTVVPSFTINNPDTGRNPAPTVVPLNE